MYLYTACPPQSKNELKNKFVGKTVLKAIAYTMYKFAVIDSLVLFNSAIDVPNKRLRIIDLV